MEYLTIDVDSRIITIPESITHLGVKDDNETRTLKFQMPSIYKGLDLSEYTIEINYINANGKSDSSLATNVNKDEETITFEWCVGGTAYAKNGKVNFLVYLYLENEDEIKTNEWHTTWAQLPVLDGGNVEEQIAEENPRIIEEMLRRLKEMENGNAGGTEDAVEYVEQELTEEQQTQARTNIGAASSEEVRQLSQDINNLDVRSIADIQKTASELLVDTYTITYTDGTSSTFQVTNGSSDEAYIASVIRSWLDEHPEATTTVQDGVITYNKLSDDVKEVIDKASKSGSTNQADLVKVMNYNDILGENKEDEYCCWTAGMCKYDKSIDKVVFMYNAKAKHVNGTCRVYMRTIDCQTLEISDSTLVADMFNIDGMEYPAISYFFFIKNDGTYEALVKAGYIDNNDKAYKVYKFLSRDHGETWTVEETDLVEQAKNKLGETFYGCFNPVRLSNGRIIGTSPCDKQYALYSDDDGDTWTLGTSCMGYNEGQIIELETEGHLVSINRNSNAYTTKTPAYLSYSEDYGDTWTQYGASKSIHDMTANNACYVVDDDNRINLFYGSRYSGDGFVCTLYKQSGTLEQLANDELDEPVVVSRGTAIEGQDFGYPACCKDKYGQVYLVYYDGDSNVKDKSTIKFALASRQNVYTPINDNVVGKTNTFSAEMVKKLLDDQYSILITKINNIISNGGGDIEDSSDGSYPISNDLLVWYDVNDIIGTTWESKVGNLSKELSNYDAENKFAYATTDIELGTIQSLGIDTSVGFSIEAVLNHTSTGGTMVCSPAVGQRYSIQCQVGDGVALRVLDINSNELGSQFLNNKILHIVLNLNMANNLATLYVNGKLKENVSVELAFNENYPWWMEVGGSGEFGIGNMRVYGKPLTVEEIQNNYKYESHSYSFTQI